MIKKFISMTSHALEPPFPLSQTITPSRTSSHSLERDVLYGRPLIQIQTGMSHEIVWDQDFGCVINEDIRCAVFILWKFMGDWTERQAINLTHTEIWCISKFSSWKSLGHYEFWYHQREADSHHVVTAGPIPPQVRCGKYLHQELGQEYR